MGGGSYDLQKRSLRSKSVGYDTLDRSELFKKRSLEIALDPKNTKVRESRDSEEHPESLAIMLGLDVTGSMGVIPHELLKDGLPTLVSKITEAGIDNPQLLMMGIGDHKCDNAPLQVAQFESSDELIDKWLQDIYLEGGGGGNGGESYLLAWYFAGFHTSIDCFEKRSKKGFLFTIGDEPVHDRIEASRLKGIMGDGEYQNMTAKELLKKAQEMYHVYHIHIVHSFRGDDSGNFGNLLSENLIKVEDTSTIAKTIADIVVSVYNQNHVIENTMTVEKEEDVELVSESFDTDDDIY